MKIEYTWGAGQKWTAEQKKEKKGGNWGEANKYMSGHDIL